MSADEEVTAAVTSAIRQLQMIDACRDFWSDADSMPETRQASDMRDDGLSLVLADNTLTIDPDYRLTQVGVYAPACANDSHRQYADAMHMGEKRDETDRILVTVGHKTSGST